MKFLFTVMLIALLVLPWFVVLFFAPNSQLAHQMWKFFSHLIDWAQKPVVTRKGQLNVFIASVLLVLLAASFALGKGPDRVLVAGKVISHVTYYEVGSVSVMPTNAGNAVDQYLFRHTGQSVRLDLTVVDNSEIKETK